MDSTALVRFKRTFLLTPLLLAVSVGSSFATTNSGIDTPTGTNDLPIAVSGTEVMHLTASSITLDQQLFMNQPFAQAISITEGWNPGHSVVINSNQIWQSASGGDPNLYFQWSTPGGAVVIGGQQGASNDLVVSNGTGYFTGAGWPAVRQQNPWGWASFGLLGNKGLGMVMHFGGDSTHELRFARTDASYNWQSNPVRFSMDAPDTSLYLDPSGNVDVQGTVSAQSSNGTTSISGRGVTFPDGTVQTTAFGGMYGFADWNGSCEGGNPMAGGGCGCPGWAPVDEVVLTAIDGVVWATNHNVTLHWCHN